MIEGFNPAKGGTGAKDSRENNKNGLEQSVALPFRNEICILFTVGTRNQSSKKNRTDLNSCF